MFDCNYCGTAHADPERGEEHIIPEALLNKRLKLRDTCANWNNFFARSFENDISTSTFMQDVLMEIAPDLLPRGRAGLVQLGPATRADGTEVIRWRRAGAVELHPKPTTDVERTINLPATDAGGNTHEVPIDLPMELLTRVVETASVDANYHAKIRAKMASSTAAVEEYVMRLTRDPSLDPQLGATLIELGLTLCPVKSLQSSVTQATTRPAEVVTDLQPRVSWMRHDAWVKSYLKIGWCFACHKLGRKRLMDLGGEPVLSYLKSGTVDRQLVEACRATNMDLAARLFRSAKLRTGTVWLWKLGSKDSETQLDLLPPSKLRDEFFELHGPRVRDDALFAAWVSGITPAKTEDLVTGADRRHHLVELLPRTFQGMSAVFCRVSLFGGFLEATAQLVPWGNVAVDDIIEVAEKVDF